MRMFLLIIIMVVALVSWGLFSYIKMNSQRDDFLKNTENILQRHFHASDAELQKMITDTSFALGIEARDMKIDITRYSHKGGEGIIGGLLSGTRLPQNTKVIFAHVEYKQPIMLWECKFHFNAKASKTTVLHPEKKEINKALRALPIPVK